MFAMRSRAPCPRRLDAFCKRNSCPANLPSMSERTAIPNCFRICAPGPFKLIHVSRELGETHYAEHKEKPFFGELVDFITSGPTFALVVEGEGAIATMRKTIGATNPAHAEPGSIRGDLAVAMPDNLVHGSDSPESAEREIALWFTDDELV